jgi:hypothetical protein
MKTEFIQPRFDGARFAEHTLPVEVARDLAAYETLIVELAKHIYLQEHPERERVPKKFASDFHLHIERIEAGSAKPMLALVMAGSLALVGGTSTYFERARDLISECISAANGTLPTAFPRELLSHFNQLGRSLREGESMQLPRVAMADAILTPESRKKLVLALDRFYEREVELLGAIEELDWGKSSFRLRLSDGTQTTVPMPDNFQGKAREYGGRSRHLVVVRGIATFDSSDRLLRVIGVESLEIQPNFTLVSRFDELAEIKDGWHDGAGLAPSAIALAHIAERFAAHFPERTPLPAIVPTQDGNLLVEWDALGEPTVDIDLNSFTASFHAFGDDAADIEKDFSLDSESQWTEFFAFLSLNIKPKLA